MTDRERENGSLLDHISPRLRPLQALVHDAVDATVDLVGEGHDSTARIVVGAISAVPGLRRPVRAVDAVRRGVTNGVLGTVRSVNRTVEAVSGAALDLTPLKVGHGPPVAQRSDALISVEGAVDQLVGVLNGALGDYLAGAESGLDLGLRLRHGPRWLTLDAASLLRDVPTASSTIVVLVHGLATTELSWSLDADRALGDPGHHYGGMLHEDLGLTPIYVRYNTGRPIAENGVDLAATLQRLVDAWPVPVGRIVLVGHSMGGLVSRAATHAATAAAHPWLDRLTHVACLGSPHQGAPLARFGHFAAGALQAIDTPGTRITGRIIHNRSAGVHDLRHYDLESIGPLIDDVAYLFVAGAVLNEPTGIAARLVGDALVTVASASGPQGPNVTVRRFGKVAHHQLQVNAEVYRAVADFLGRTTPRLA